MHRVIGDAIAELRRTQDWTQAELAREISRHARRGTPAPLPNMISLWETGVRAPASEYRGALARIARKDRATEELAPLFLAAMESWRVVSRVRLLHQRRRASQRP
jgi:transcriptional regulator with XRE-family HTH domain